MTLRRRVFQRILLGGLFALLGISLGACDLAAPPPTPTPLPAVPTTTLVVIAVPPTPIPLTATVPADPTATPDRDAAPPIVALRTRLAQLTQAGADYETPHGYPDSLTGR